MIKALLIDLFDTLVFFEEERYILWRKEMASYLNIDREAFLQFWWSYTRDRFLGKIRDISHMLAIAADHFNIELKEKDRNYLAGKELEVLLSISHLYPDTLEVLASIKKEGFLIALVSNASTNAIHILDHLQLSPLFDTMVISCDVGVAKPEEEIYRLVLARLGVKPEECLFIGDGACQELDGARKIGIHTVRIRQEPQTRLFGESACYDFEISRLEEAIEIAKKL